MHQSAEKLNMIQTNKYYILSDHINSRIKSFSFLNILKVIYPQEDITILTTDNSRTLEGDYVSKNNRYILIMNVTPKIEKVISEIENKFKDTKWKCPVLIGEYNNKILLKYSLIGTGSRYGEIYANVMSPYITFSEYEDLEFESTYNKVKDLIIDNLSRTSKMIVCSDIFSKLWELDIVHENIYVPSNKWDCYGRTSAEITKMIYGMPARFATHSIPNNFKSFLDQYFFRYTCTEGVFYVFIASFVELKNVTDAFYKTQEHKLISPYKRTTSRLRETEKYKYTN